MSAIGLEEARVDILGKAEIANLNVIVSVD